MKKLERLLVINGPNMNMLGIREPAIYGTKTYSELKAFIASGCEEMGIKADFFQSNHEGEIIDRIQNSDDYDGVVINPAAYSHTSLAIADAIRASRTPFVEVHISDIYSREAMRRQLITGEACISVVSGEGFDGYLTAVRHISDFVSGRKFFSKGHKGYIAEFSKVSRAVYGDNPGYDDILLPCRATEGSAGYDFFAPFRFELTPGESIVIPTGIRVKLDKDWVLMLFPRSGLGFKHGLRLENTVGIIDSDYYGADNEGHIMIKLANGTTQLRIEKGSAFAQGILLPYGTAKEEPVLEKRTGGFGSTGD